MVDKNTDKQIWRLVYIIIAVVIVAGFFVPYLRTSFGDKVLIEKYGENWNSYTNTAYDLKVLYPLNYTLVQSEELQEGQALVFSFLDELGSTATSQENLPVGLTVTVFENRNNLSVRDWVLGKRESQLSSNNKFFTTTHIGGEDALRYAGNSPEIESAAVVHGAYIYLFTARNPAQGENDNEEPFDLFHTILQRVQFLGAQNRE